MPRIPLARPELLFSIQVPRTWAGFLERPVVAPDAVLVAGDDASAEAVDPVTGRRLFLLSQPLEATEAYAGLPLPLPGSGALIPVHRVGAWLRVFRVDADGVVRAVDEPGVEAKARGEDLRVAAQDVACKLSLMPLARGAGDDYLVSWIYRQVRFYRTECRRLAGGLRWASPEMLVGTTNDVVLGVKAPVRGTDDRGELICRSIHDGHVLWSLPARHRTLAAASPDQFFLLDRTGRMAANAARKAMCEDEVAEALAEDASLTGQVLDKLRSKLFARRPLRHPSRIVALDAMTGGALWEAEVPGDVASIGGPGGGVLAAVAIDGTEARLHRLDAATGASLGASSLGGGWPTSPLDALWTEPASFDQWSSLMPSIVAVDERAILWSSPEELFAERLAEPGDRLWQWPLPAPCRAFRPRILDRMLNEPAISLGEERIYLRQGWSLWGIGTRSR